MSLRTWQQNMTTFVLPLQCDLQPGIPQPHKTTHTRRHAKCRTPRENLKTSKRAYPQPPHTRAAFHRRLQPLYTEKHTVLCSGFLPKTSPMQYSYRAITLRFAAARAHSFSTSPLLLVTTSLSHHPSSPPFAAARAHSFSTSPLPFVTTALSHHCP